ncbi:hypothetical protein EMIHUDRAFT_243737 [Emiliania huxleyi CCMP1516]|uniref:Uncharacterized protein n=2 Tax=Emiliania huxleyi TaxID=2903 RepID=A0A0D3J4Y8_EMIH1|nr:hypothetical protein EMIHUDRAFT_243737 [Emiliania huxleyi CCMP1516]EOD18573.1 hypothetical protein EMIHUDRAFT_243737 [Emiliania huxleyi CCMP1516]|eukprot:XP_005771002.1 hypothetical protein EMIHUDRAFT_243737 [Emiliania huxleyi CCMP1516]
MLKHRQAHSRPALRWPCEDEDEDSDSGDTPLKLQINLTTEVEREVDLFLESEEEQFTFEELYCTLPPWARGRQKEVLAALKRLVNGYSVSPAKLIMDDDDDQSVDMDELVFRPNPERGLELSNSDDPDGCNAPIDTMAETVRAIIGASLPPNLVCLTYYSTCGVIEGPVACIATAVAALVQHPVTGIPKFLRDLSRCLVGSGFTLDDHDPETGEPLMMGR